MTNKQIIKEYKAKDQETVKEYHRCRVTVWRVEGQHHPYPWRFSIEYDDKTHLYAVIPNQDKTKESASYRALLLSDGSYGSRYV